ncbi:hypothetical protein D3C73_1512350 [compost metagenome]
MESADQRDLVLTDQGQPGVFQFAGDGVGKVLAVTQRIRLLEWFGAWRVEMGRGGAIAGFEQGVAGGFARRPVWCIGIAQEVPNLLQYRTAEPHLLQV